MNISRRFLQVLVCTVLYGFSLQAQNGYVFREFEEMYVPVPEGDTLTAPFWDDDEIDLPGLPPIKMFGKPMQGPLVFDSALGFVDPMDSLSVMAPWFTDLMSSRLDSTLHLSPIIYYPDPVFDMRLFTLEWRNAHFTLLDGFFDFVNFQIHYFSDGTIQFRYGESSTDLAKVAYREEGEIFGGNTGIGTGPSDTLISGLFLEGELDSYTILENQLGLLEDFPSENTVYEFKPVQSNVSDHNADNRCFTYIHYQEQGTIEVQDQGTQNYVLISTSGQILQVSSGANRIDLSNLPSGIYYLNNTNCGQSEVIYHL